MDNWVSMMFFQPKGKARVAKFDNPYWGLYKQGDVLQVIRPLADKGCVDLATSDWIPVHWVEMSPDRMLQHREILPGTCRFKFYDAYFAVIHQTSMRPAVSYWCCSSSSCSVNSMCWPELSVVNSATLG